MAVTGSLADAAKLRKNMQNTVSGNTTVIGKTGQMLGAQATAQAMQPKVASTPTSTTYTSKSDWMTAQGKPATGGLPPKTTTTATTTTQLPKEPVFGTTASQINTTTPTYLDTRNTDLAKQYSTQGLKTQDQVMAELMKNQEFSGASDADRLNTATEIFKKMSQPTEAIQVKTDDMASDTKQYTTIQEAEADNPRTQNLSAEEKQVYNMLSEAEKKQFLNIGRMDLKNAMQYLARWKEAKAYQEDRNKNALELNRLQTQNADIQAGAELRQSEAQLNKLKANIAYLGTMGAPGVSAVKLDAVNKQITEAETVMSELRTVQANMKRMREIGADDLVDQMARQMQLLQDDLDDKVNKTIQNAFNDLTAEQIKGGLDTVEDIDAFRTKLLTNLDNEISGLTDDNIKARAFLIERFDVIAQEKKAYMENANKINVDMSTAQGYYVDGNGNPVISMSTGQPIPMPVKPPMDPIFDKESGKLIMFSTGPDGGIVAKVQQVTSGNQGGGKIETIYTTDEFGNEVKQSVMVMPDGTIRPIGGGSIGGGNAGGGIVATGDLRHLADQFPGEASLKNNNPAGITRSKGFADRLTQAGIPFEKGTPRPANEGNNYFAFPTIEDGFAAYDLLRSGDSYQKLTLREALNRWNTGNVNKGYGDTMPGQLGIDGNTKVSDMTPDQLRSVQMAQIQRESPGLYKILSSGGEGQQQVPQQNKQEMMMQAMGLLQGTGGTEGERQKMAQNIVQTAIKNNIPLNEAKKKLGYRTQEDNEFVKNVRRDYETIKKGDDATSNAKRLVSLLSQEQTPITDIASIVGFLKSIDPSSVARESETEQIRKARSLIDSMGVYAQQIATGKSLSEKQRNEIKAAAQTIATMGDSKLKTEIGGILTEFDERGLDATSVVRRTDIDKYAPVSYKINTSKDKTITPVQQQAPLTTATPQQTTTQVPSTSGRANRQGTGRY